ncbi:MAG: DUF2752 domain-containing protein [Saprospiraceae bacterium]
MEVTTTQRSNKALAWLRLCFFIIVPIVLLALPSDFFDNGKPMCVSVLLFDLECYGCGMTRAMMHLIHFEFLDAYYFNPLSFLVFPLLAWLWLRWFLRDLKRVRN